jgi:hypothetical protein
VGDKLHVAEQSLVVLYFEEGEAVLVAEGTVIHKKPLQLAVEGLQSGALRFHLLLFILFICLIDSLE